MTAEAGSRRDRLRESTLQEIISVARRQAVEHGAAAISMRAIAREMGMTAPALYRYFDSLDALVEALVASLYDDLTAALEEARDELAGQEVAMRLLATCWAFRRWAVQHPAEFGLIFGSPIPGYAASQRQPAAAPEGPSHEAAMRFSGVFAGLFTELWTESPFPIVRDEEIEAGLRDDLAAYAQSLGTPLPLGAVQVFLSAWVRLYGTVSLEVFGHTKFAVQNAEPLFELQMRDIGVLLGVIDPSASERADDPRG